MWVVTSTKELMNYFFRPGFDLRPPLLALTMLLGADGGEVVAQTASRPANEDPARQVHWAMGAFFLPARHGVPRAPVKPVVLSTPWETRTTHRDG